MRKTITRSAGLVVSAVLAGGCAGIALAPTPGATTPTPTFESEILDVAEPTQEAQATALDEAGDADAVGESQETLDPAAPLIHEGDPRWDCRTMGNLSCGVEVHGERFVITFDEAGEPVGVTR